MGLLTVLRKLRLKEKEMRVLILYDGVVVVAKPNTTQAALHLHSGLDNAGKTSVVKTFNGESIDTISPTLGFNIQTLAFEE